MKHSYYLFHQALPLINRRLRTILHLELEPRYWPIPNVTIASCLSHNTHQFKLVSTGLLLTFPPSLFSKSNCKKDAVIARYLLESVYIPTINISLLVKIKLCTFETFNFIRYLKILSLKTPVFLPGHATRR